MKKKLVASLAVAMVLGVVGTSFAASNPFVDVPAKHWSYDAVNQLTKAGISEGYGDGTFRGDKTISRYEMAVIVAKAMTKSDKADANNKALIEKLAAEYANELDKIGVRVDTLEKKVDKVKISGTVRARYDSEKINHVNNPNVDRQLFIELVTEAKLNKDWSAVAKFEASKKAFGTETTQDSQFDMKKLYVTGPISGATFMGGKFGWTPGYGTAWDNDTTGATLSFGKTVKTTLFAGKPADLDKLNGYGAQFTYAVTPKTNIGLLIAGATSSESNVDANSCNFAANGATNGGGKRTVYELGFDTKLSQDFKLTTAYAKSNASDLNTNYKVQIDYKGADSTIAKSYGAYVKYAKYEAKGGIKPGGDIDPNQKGIQVGFDYVPMENSKISLWYFDKKFITTDIKDTKYRAQVEFYF